MKNNVWNGLNLLEREHIVSIIAKASEVPFTLIVAPMGYGKTTIVHNFLDRQTKADKVWLSIGQEEGDDIWIWQRFCERLKEAKIPFYQQLMDLGFPTNQVEFSFLIRAIKEELSRPLYLVIDNYQELNSKVWDNFLENIIYEKIENLHIILISRIYPEISYDEMWIKGYCILIEQEMLSLSKEELRQFFKENNILLTDEELECLNNYTDGWICAAYLALLNYKRKHKLEKFGSIIQLLRTSIYNKFPESIKELLMKMSLFDEFTPEQASYIMGREYNQAILYEIAENIGFIKYDGVNGTFSLHTLLKAVANIELENRRIDKKELYYRCGEWYQEKKKFVQAIQNYQKAENVEKIFEIIENEYSFTLCEKAPSVIENFFQSLPKEIKLKHPVAYLQIIYAKILNSNSKDGKFLFQEAKEYYEKNDIEIPKNRMMGELKILEALTLFNDLDKITDCMKQACLFLDGNHSFIFDERIIFTYGAPEIQTLYHRTPGGLKRVLENLKRYNAYGRNLIKGLEGDWSQLFEAEYYLTIGEFEQADKFAEMACEKAKFRKQICVIISSYFARMRCDIYFGRKAKFEQHMRELKEEMTGIMKPVLILDYELAVSFLYGKIKQYDKMAEWLKDFKLDECNRVIRSIRSGCISYGIILMKDKQWVCLEALTEEMLILYGNTKHVFVFLTAYIYRAISSYHLYGMEQAVFYLEKAMKLAEPDGIKMPFIENSEQLYPILKHMKKKDLYIKELLRFCEVYQRNLEGFLDKKQEKSKIVLTKREIQMMHLVAQGYKNNEICHIESIALVTVEKTLTNIYRKLQVTNRTAAIHKLREMEIL